MIACTFRALTKWPTVPTKHRTRAQFHTHYDKTRAELLDEIEKIRGRSVVIQAAVREDEIRNDGMLRGSARPHEPGIIVSFTTPDGELQYICDRYDDWHDNLRAISQTLKALRSVSRWGCNKGNEQYQGFKALPPGDSAPSAPTMSSVDAVLFLAEKSGMKVEMIHCGVDVAQLAYRRAAKKCHPDQGGSQDLFLKLTAAMEVLKSSGVA